jgi:hypothetical protein
LKQRLQTHDGQFPHVRLRIHWFSLALIMVMLASSLTGCGLARRLLRPVPSPSLSPVATPTSESSATLSVEPTTPKIMPAEISTASAVPATSVPGSSETQTAPAQVTPIVVPGGGDYRLLGSYVRPQDIGAYCQQMQTYSVRFIWMQVPWSLIEPQKGRFEWDQADRILQDALDCGLDIGVHVHARSKWATLPTPPFLGRTAPSTPPTNMDDYYNFLFTLANRYKGKVSRYSIEEEAHAAGVYFAGTPEQYMEMLATANRAIHDADPDAIVQDSGLSSSAVGALYGHSLMESGKTTEASEFLRTWYQQYAPTRAKGESFSFDSEAGLQAFFSHDQVKRLLTWVDLLWSEHSDDYDVQQIHYFGPWEVMPDILDWLHSELAARGSDKPIEFWEFGYGWDDEETYDPAAHAQDEAKYMAMAIGEGVLRALSWQFTDYAAFNGHPGLVTATGPRPAAQAFGVTAQKLNGTTNSARLDLGPGVWAYRYEKDTGLVYVLWSEAPVRVSLPTDRESMTVTDITGQTRIADPSTLEVGTSPIFVESSE